MMEADSVNLNANSQGGLIAVTVVMLVVATLAVLLRTCSILLDKSRKLGLDDLCVTLSLVGDQKLTLTFWVKAIYQAADI